jgi:hypothetical protein
MKGSVVCYTFSFYVPRLSLFFPYVFFHPVQWVPGVLSPGVKRGRGVMLTTHPHLVPRLRMSRSYTSSHPKRLHGV